MAKTNNKVSQNSWLASAIKYGLYLCLFMPLITSGKFIFPYIFPKQAFFQIIVEIVLALYLFLAFKDPRYRPRSSKLMWALLVYFIILILSAVFGSSPYHSFWSSYERMAGVIALWHYLAFLFVAVNFFKTKEQWYEFFTVSIVVSLLEAFYGLGQLFGERGFLAAGSRVDGTIGNSSFLGGYMLINSLFAFWLFLEKRNFSWRLFYAAAALVNLFILYETQTRGAMLGLFVGLFVLALLFVFAPGRALAQLPLSQPRRLKKYAAGLLLAVMLFVPSIFIFKNTSFVKNHPTLDRLASISFEETTSKTRLLAWQMSLKGFQENPIFGWGPENYNIVFNKYYDPDLYPVESWFDRAHNAFLDVLVHTGLVGFLAYGAIFLLAFWSLWRGWLKEKISYPTAAIFSAILIGYGVQNFFVFDTQVTLLMFYSLLAFIAFVGFSLTEEKSGETGQPVRVNAFFKILVYFLVFLSIYFINIKPGLASKTGIEAVYLFQSDKFSQAVEKINQAYEIGTFGLAENAARAFDSAMQLSSSATVDNATKKEMADVAIDGMKKGLELEPLNARYWMMLGNLNLVSAQLDIAYLAEADIALSRALELSPTRQELLFALGQLRASQGRKGEALNFLKQAVELKESIPVSHWNYGLIAVSLGEKELGEEEIKRAVELGYGYSSSAISRLISAYGQTKDYSKMVSLYDDWIELEPTNAAPYAGLAATYAQMGEKQKAKDTALKAIQIDPTYRTEAEQFIKGLGI